MNPKTYHCSCGTTELAVTGSPLFRVFCHCTICQRFNDAPYSDVVVYDAASVSLKASDTVEFKAYKPPPNVQRGKCVKCGDPAIEQFEAPLMPSLTIVPTPMHGDAAELLKPIAHIFYGTRVSEVADDLPKHEGFVASQLAFGKFLLSAKLFKKKTR